MRLLSPGNARRVAKRVAGLAPSFFAGQVCRPFFIIGSARSGTSILLQSLSHHPDVAAYPSEANRLWHPQTYPWRTSDHWKDLPPLWADPETFTARSLALRADDHARRLRAHFGAFQLFRGGTCLLNKSAMIAFMLPYVREVFPEARFVHIVRDGRAVTRSYLKKQKKKIDSVPQVYRENGYAGSFDELLDVFADTWKRHLQEIEKQKAPNGALAGDGRLYELSYEDFCADTTTHLRRIAAFMGLDASRFDERELPSVRSTNYKYEEDLSDAQIERITAEMEPVLTEKGYTSPVG